MIGSCSQVRGSEILTHDRNDSNDDNNGDSNDDNNDDSKDNNIDDSKDDNNGDSKDDSNDDNNGDNNDNLHKQSPPAPILTGKRLRRDPVSFLL